MKLRDSKRVHLYAGWAQNGCFCPCSFHNPSFGEEAKCLWTPYTHLFFRDLISYCWYNPQPMRNDHSVAGTTILQTTLEDADSTQFHWWLDKSGGKGSSWTSRRFGVQHHRQSVAMEGKVGSTTELNSVVEPTFPFMATDWRWCWTPKRLEVQLLPLPPDLSNHQ